MGPGLPRRVKDNDVVVVVVVVVYSQSSKEWVVPAGFSLLYTWDDPLLDQQLQWQVVGEGSHSDAWSIIQVSMLYVRNLWEGGGGFYVPSPQRSKVHFGL